MNTPLTMHMPPHGTRPVIAFDYRFVSVPYQRVDMTKTVSVSTQSPSLPTGRQLTLHIDAQRLAESLRAVTAD